MRVSMILEPEEIAMDRGSFHWQDSAPDSKEGPGTHYRIDLRGKADRSWRKAFYLVQWDYFGLFKFHLSEDGRSVTFHRGAEEAIEQEEMLLKALEVLMKIVNGRATKKTVEFPKFQGRFQGAALAV